MPVQLGQRVLAHFRGGEQEFPGTISACYSDNTYAIDYDDGDSEDRVDYSLIRKISNPAASNPRSGGGADPAALARAIDENNTLRGQIKQMIALSQEEDAETENLVQSMSASLSDSRRTNDEKDAEIQQMRRALSDAKKQAKAQATSSQSSSKYNQQIEELKGQMKKAREAEAAAKRAHQSTKAEFKQAAEERREAMEVTVQSLTQQIAELRDAHSSQQTDLNHATREMEATQRGAAEREKLSSADRQRDAQAKADLARALKESQERAKLWEHKHHEVQVLSDQAYEIMKDELLSKDEQLRGMHSEVARLSRESADAAMLYSSAGSARGNNKSSSSNSLKDSRSPSSGNTDDDDGGDVDDQDSHDRQHGQAQQQQVQQMVVDQLHQERDRNRALIQQLRGRCAHLEVAQERATGTAERVAVAHETALSAAEAEAVEAKSKAIELEERLKQQRQQRQPASEVAVIDADDDASMHAGVTRGEERAINSEELEMEVRSWKRKHRELSELSDEAYAIMSAQLKEKDAMVLDLRLKLASSSSSASKAAKTASSPLTDSTNIGGQLEQQPQTKSLAAKDELSWSLDKLRQKWQSKEHGDEQEQLEQTNRASPPPPPAFRPVVVVEPDTEPSSSTTSGRSTPEVQIQAQAARLAVLEKEVALTSEREADLREELIQARAEIRRLRALLDKMAESSDGDQQQRVPGSSDEGAVQSEGNNNQQTPSRRASLEEVKGHIRRLSKYLMEGDETRLGEYEKWEAALLEHPDYQAETQAELVAFEQKHAARNAASLETTRRFLPPNIWTTTFKSFKKAAFHLPEKLVKHLWDNKILWWARLHPRYIAKIHVADLRSKYAIKHLDLVELRTVLACLPKVFDNDTTGEKAAWRANTMEAVRALLNEDERTVGGLANKNKARNRLYFNKQGGITLQGPFDAEPPTGDEGSSHGGVGSGGMVVQSEAFAPTPQFESVGRLDDNVLLRMRRDNIVGANSEEAKEIKRQVPQFTEIHSLTENPEMRRRREAFLAAELMKERTRSNQLLNALDLPTVSAGNSPTGRLGSLAALIKHDAEMQKQRGGELQALFSLVGDENNAHRQSSNQQGGGGRKPTQWDADQGALREALSSREERTRHDFNTARASVHGGGGGGSGSGKYAEWEMDLARARQQKEREETEERRQEKAAADSTRGNVLRADHRHAGKGSSGGHGTGKGVPFVAKQRPWAAARRKTIVPSGGRAIFDGATRDKVARGSGIIKSTDRMSHLVNKYKV